MINVIKADGKKLEVQVVGTVPTLCSDLSNIIQSMCESMDDEVSTLFKLTFLMGLKKGIVFGVSESEMKDLEQAAEVELAMREQNKTDKLSEIDTLLDKINELNRMIHELEERNNEAQ